MRATKFKPRSIKPDPLYGSPRLAKLINRVMKDGKKGVAQRQVYKALDLIKTNTKKDPVLVFEEAIKNITPQMMVRSRRVGGAAYQVPMPVKDTRGFSIAVRWLIIEAQNRDSKTYHTFSEKLSAEILDATKNEGGAISRKLNAHRQAEANKAFAHFRW
ncbi:MAG: 30S ribosomal protein S7 [Candidatus Chisholmbacteria bacterium]|nr:30S ribosomal protein S7 [Candidatus Chisholmbacteria bacterium]